MTDTNQHATRDTQARLQRRLCLGKDTVQIREAADGGPILEGYAAVYYQPGDAGTQYELWPGTVERIRKGAFDGLLKSADEVYAIYNHSRDNLLGRRGNETLKLSSDRRGLRYQIKPPDTELGREVVELVRRGDLAGSSFGFSAADEEFQREEVDDLHVDVHYLDNIVVRELGPVVAPAYSGTSVSLRSDGELEATRAAFWAWEREQVEASLERLRG